jgi:hypothetical protein
MLQVHHHEKKQALVDILSVYAAGGKAIVFTRTKMGADEVAAAISQQQPCEALHGDIPQNQREKTLGRFRQGEWQGGGRCEGCEQVVMLGGHGGMESCQWLLFKPATMPRHDYFSLLCGSGLILLCLVAGHACSCG